jgi:hypothetical protein
MVPDTGFWCRRGGIALGLLHRESNGCHAGDAQNGRDEFGWLLNGLSGGIFLMQLDCSRSTETYVCH